MHLDEIVTEGRTSEDPDASKMRPVPVLLVLGDVTKDEFIETLVRDDVSSDAGNWHENRPRDDPDGQEDLGYHTEETDEEVGVHSVRWDHGGMVCFENSDRPSEDTGRQGLSPFAERAGKDKRSYQLYTEGVWCRRLTQG